MLAHAVDIVVTTTGMDSCVGVYDPHVHPCLLGCVIVLAP